MGFVISKKVNKQENLDDLLRNNHPSTDVEVQPAVQLQPYTWKEIRLFLSSSFIDTHAERDALIKRVIPNLNRKLAARFIYIVPVDLRWGLLKEESNDCYAIQKTCLNQVDQCRQVVDEHPWFLGLRTDRYGWVQDKLLERAEHSNPQRYDWVKTLEDNDKQLSITSLECIHAIVPLKKNIPVPTCLFYKRQISNPEDIEKNLKWVFDFEFVPGNTKLTAEVQNQYTKTNSAMTYKKDQENLDKYMKNLDHVKYSTYQCRYEKNGARITGDNGLKKFGVGYVSGLEEFEKLVEKDLLDAIDKCFKKADISGLPKYVLENIPHEHAVKEKASTFVGRGKLSEEIYQHCKSEHVENSVMIIHGNPGCGKSALLADVTTKCLNDLREQGEFVFAHAVDSCSGSNNFEVMLRRLQVNLRKYRIKLGETGLSEKCSTSIANLKGEHVNLIKESARKHSKNLFIILVDAVNQFHDSLQAWAMWWLPSKDAPNNLRFVISTLNEENGTFENACKMCPNAVKVSVGEMSYGDGQEMVSTILARYNKKLTTTDGDAFLGNQMKKLLIKNLSPLYLTAATQALRRFGVYENVGDYINSLPHNIPDLFNFLLSNWSKEYGEEFIRDIVCIICLSKDGVLENEINDMLSFIEKEKSVDYQCSFSRVYDSLSGFLAAGGGGYLRFFHDQLNKVVRNKFLTTAFKLEMHGWLIRFYLHNIQPQLSEHPGVEAPSYYQHCLEQVVYHQLESVGTSGEKIDFTYTLRNIYFVRERFIHHQEDLLQQEYIKAFRSSIDENQKATLKQWAKFAQLYSSHLEKFPKWAYNMAINQIPTSPVAVDTSKFPQPATCDGYPLYWTNISSAEDAMALKYQSDHSWCCVASTSDKNLVCIGSYMKKKAFLYETDTGVLLHEVEVGSKVGSVYLSTRYKTFWTGDGNGFVKVWNAETGGEEWRKYLNKQDEEDEVNWIVSVEHYVACGTTHTVSFFDEATGHVVKSWPVEPESRCYCFHDGKHIIITGHTKVIKCWNLDGSLTKTLEVGGHCVDSLSIHPSNEDVIAIAIRLELTDSDSWKCCVKQMNLSTGEVLCTIPDTSECGGALYDKTGKRVLCVCGDDDKTIMVYGEDGKLQNKIKGHSQLVFRMCLVPGTDELLTVACDGSMLFNLPTTPDGNLGDEGADEVIKCCEFLPGGDEFVTLNERGELRIWLTSSCEPRKSVHVEGCDKWSGRLVAHPCTNYIAAYSRKDLHWFDTENLQKVATVNVIPQSDDDSIWEARISHDGTRCLVARWQRGIAIVYDITNINDIKESVRYNTGGWLDASDIHQDNERVVSGYGRGVDLWSLSTGQKIRRLVDGSISYVTFLYAPDRVLYVVNQEYQAHIMDMQGVHLVKFDGTIHSWRTLALTKNYTQLITGEKEEKTIRFHDTHTGEVLYTFADHRSEAFICVAAHPSNNMVIAGNSNGMFYILNDTPN